MEIKLELKLEVKLVGKYNGGMFLTLKGWKIKKTEPPQKTLSYLRLAIQKSEKDQP